MELWAEETNGTSRRQSCAIEILLKGEKGVPSPPAGEGKGEGDFDLWKNLSAQPFC
jgi:hypothetical protein